jgi:hypothetical protein
MNRTNGFYREKPATIEIIGECAQKKIAVILYVADIKAVAENVVGNYLIRQELQAICPVDAHSAFGHSLVCFPIASRAIGA